MRGPAMSGIAQSRGPLVGKAGCSHQGWHVGCAVAQTVYERPRINAPWTGAARLACDRYCRRTPSTLRKDVMGRSSSARLDDHLVGTLSRAPAPRTGMRDNRPAITHDAVLLGTTSFNGDAVYDAAGRFLGEIEELILDLPSGRVGYALMAAGGFLGMGRELFSIPWAAVPSIVRVSAAS